MAQESKRFTKSILKAFKILECFEISPNLSLKQLNDITKFHKSLIIRICGTLASEGYLIYNSKTKQYSLGPKFLCLGKIYEQNNSLISLSRPILQELAQLTGESSAVYVIDNYQRLCLVRVRGTHNLRYSIKAGQHLDLYAGASGKVLLAFSPEEYLHDFLKKKLIRRHTPKTIVDPKEFIIEIKKIRRDGYATSFGEWLNEVGALAAPVYNQENKLCASIGIGGPISRLKKNYKTKYLKHILNAAKRLSIALGYRS